MSGETTSRGGGKSAAFSSTGRRGWKRWLRDPGSGRFAILSTVWRYGLAVGAVAAGYVLRVGLEAWSGPRLPPFITFYPIVMIVALLGGVGPGLLAMALAALIVAVWISPPIGELKIGLLVDQVALALFLCMSVFIIGMAELYRRNRAKAAAYDRQQALRESEDRWRTIVASEPECVKVLDAKGNVVEMNPAGLEMVQGTWDQVRGQCVLDLVAGESKAAFEEMIAAVFRGQKRRLVFDLIGLKGRRRTMETVSVPLGDPAQTGRVKFLLGLTRDITERKRAEEALRESEQRLALAVGGTRVGIFDWDLAETEIAMTDQSAQLLGLPLTTTTTTTTLSRRYPVKELARCVHPDDLPALRAAYEGAGANRQAMELEFRVLWPEGSVHWLSTRAVFEQDMGSAPRRLRGVLMDITERKANQEALRQSEELLRQAMEAAQAGSWKVNLATGEFTASERAVELHGLPPGTPLTHERALACVHPDDQAAVAAAIARTVESGEPFRMEHRVPQPDGTIRWVNSQAERRSEGGQTCLVGLVQDITARKAAQEAIRNSEANMAAAQRIAHVGSWTWDILADSAQWSEETYRIFGMEMGTLKGQHRENFIDRVHPDDRATVDRALGEAISGKKDYDLEYRILLPDGTQKVIYAKAEVERNAQGKAIFMRGTVQDITERKAAQEALRESEARFRSMVEEAPLGVAIVDSLTSRFYRVNPAFARMTGRTVEELQGTDWVAITHPDDVQGDLDRMAEMNAGKIPGFQMEKRYRRPDGSYFWVSITVAPMYVTDKTKPRHLLMVEDIDTRKAAEAALREHARELAEANEDLVRFNRAAVGRENRMIELKKEVNALRAAAGLPLRYPLEFEKNRTPEGEDHLRKERNEDTQNQTERHRKIYDRNPRAR